MISYELGKEMEKDACHERETKKKNSDVIDLALCRLSGRASERGIGRS